jgi:hypothetical protein
MKKIAVGSLLMAGALIFSGCGDSDGGGDGSSAHEEIVKDLYALIIDDKTDRQKFDAFAEKYLNMQELDRWHPTESSKDFKKVFARWGKWKAKAKIEVVKTGECSYTGNTPYSIIKVSIPNEDRKIDFSDFKNFKYSNLCIVVRGQGKDSSKIVDMACFSDELGDYYRFREKAK